MKLYPDADVLLSFASLRSAYESTVEAMEYPQVFSYFSVIFSTLVYIILIAEKLYWVGFVDVVFIFLIFSLPCFQKLDRLG